MTKRLYKNLSTSLIVYSIVSCMLLVWGGVVVTKTNTNQVPTKQESKNFREQFVHCLLAFALRSRFVCSLLWTGEMGLGQLLVVMLSLVAVGLVLYPFQQQREDVKVSGKPSYSGVGVVLISLLHLLSFATSFGSSLWVSFIGGIIMFKWVYYLFFPSSWRWTMCVCVHVSMSEVIVWWLGWFF